MMRIVALIAIALIAVIDIFADKTLALPEVTVVDSRKHKVTHIVAYVREYSTLTHYTDTVFLLREKIVDFMLPRSGKVKFTGWSIPRTLQSSSYYRFTDHLGLDSVSDTYHQHFSWSDWVGLPTRITLPLHSPDSEAEHFTLSDNSLTAEIDVLADTLMQRWTPQLKGYLHRDINFDCIKLRYDYDINSSDSVRVGDISRYSFEIASSAGGRLRSQSTLLRNPCHITTSADVIVLDRRNITLKEAAKWQERKYYRQRLDDYSDLEIPELPDDMQLLVDRVNSIDHERLMLNLSPDKRLIRKFEPKKQSLGRRLLNLLPSFS